MAVSVVPGRTVSPDAPIEARAVAASALTAFTNTLFVALDGLIPSANLGTVILIVSRARSRHRATRADAKQVERFA